MTILDRVPLERISAQARQVDARRALLTLVAGLFFVVGWLAFKVVAVLWLVIVWCAVATREGWRDARKQQRVSRGPARAG